MEKCIQSYLKTVCMPQISPNACYHTNTRRNRLMTTHLNPRVPGALHTKNPVLWSVAIATDPITNTPNILSTPGSNKQRKKATALEFLTDTTKLQKTGAFSASTTPENSKTDNDANLSAFMEIITEKALTHCKRITIPWHLPPRLKFFAGTTCQDTYPF